MSNQWKEKQYLPDQSRRNLYLIMTVVGVMGFLTGLFLDVSVSGLGLLAVAGIIPLATKNKPVLQLKEKYFEYKPAPLASVLLIKYDDVDRVEHKDKSVFVYARGRNKPVKILLTLFKESEREEVSAQMEQIAVKS